MNPCTDMNPTTRPASSEQQNPERNQPRVVKMGHNSNFDERLARYATREIVQERGIDLEELWNSFVPMVVSQRGWGKFVQQLIRANKKDVVARGPDPAVGQPIPPAYAAAMFNSLERRLGGLKGDINDKFDNLNARVGAMEATLGAIKLGQGEMETEASTTCHAQ
ncbi:hypothetical protein ACOSP7_014151 [Xanthoceras sorbifolium]